MPKSNSELPISYLGWRSGLPREATVLFHDREWTLVSVDALWKEVVVDGRKGPYVEQSRLFAQSIAETTEQTATSDADGEAIPFSQIENLLTIGCEYEDLLCVDPSDGFSVWAVPSRLEDWMEQAEPID
jgi:hypothetical protein